MNKSAPLWLLILGMAVAGCPGDEGDGTTMECKNEVMVTNAEGALHGRRCSSDADCRFGACVKDNRFVAFGDGLGYCTKNCSCGEASACSDEDGADLPNTTYDCARPRTEASASFAQCLIKCESVADCTAIDMAYTRCEPLPASSDLSSTSNTVCQTEPAEVTECDPQVEDCTPTDPTCDPDFAATLTISPSGEAKVLADGGVEYPAVAVPSGTTRVEIEIGTDPLVSVESLAWDGAVQDLAGPFELDPVITPMQEIILSGGPIAVAAGVTDACGNYDEALLVICPESSPRCTMP